MAPPAWAQLLLLGLWWLSVSLLEPIYVAAGFGLYLHRRTQLEAWDVELVFRRLAARVRVADDGSVSAEALSLAAAAEASVDAGEPMMSCDASNG